MYGCVIEDEGCWVITVKVTGAAARPASQRTIPVDRRGRQVTVSSSNWLCVVGGRWRKERNLSVRTPGHVKGQPHYCEDPRCPPFIQRPTTAAEEVQNCELCAKRSPAGCNAAPRRIKTKTVETVCPEVTSRKLRDRFNSTNILHICESTQFDLRVLTMQDDRSQNCPIHKLPVGLYESQV